MIKLIKKSHKVNTHTTSKDLEDYKLSCGDKVIYYRSVGYPIRGWYLGASESGKTNFMLTTGDSILKPYYQMLKYNWKDLLPDSRYPREYENYQKALATLDEAKKP